MNFNMKKIAFEIKQPTLARLFLSSRFPVGGDFCEETSLL